MARKTKATGDAPKSPPTPLRPTWDRRLRLAALAILLLGACSRMLLTESLAPPWSIFSGAVAELDDGKESSPIEWGGPTPADSMAIAAWILLAGLLWATAQAISPRPLVARPALLLIGMFAVAATISLIVASNKAAARNHAVQFVGYLASFWLLLQLLDTARLRQAALVAALAAGAIFAAGTIHQKYWAIPEFAAGDWAQKRVEFFRAQGWAADDPLARQYEERVREVKGFAINSNMAAALLIVVVTASAGWAVEKWRAGRGGQPVPLRRVFAAVAGAVAVAAFFALCLTASRGGIFSCLLALLLFAMLAFVRDWATRHWRKLAIGVGVASVLVAATVAVATECTPQPGPDSFWYHSGAAQSLLVRWQYWVAAGQIWHAHPLGVGGGNFATAYASHKLPAALEDVDNPHNFVLAALVEYGPLGAIALVGLLAWALIALSRPTKAPSPLWSAATCRRFDSSVARVSNPCPDTLVLFAVLFGVGLPIVRAFLQWPNYGDVVVNIVIAMLAPVLVLVLTLGRDRVAWPVNIGEGWVRRAIGCGLAGFLLASTIDFGMSNAGSATAFWTFAAIALAGKIAGGRGSGVGDRGKGDESTSAREREGATDERDNPIALSRSRALAPSSVFRLVAISIALVLLVQFTRVYLPVKSAETLMWRVARGDQSVVVEGPRYTSDFYDAAIASDPWEPEVPMFMAGRLLGGGERDRKRSLPSSTVQQANALYDLAHSRDPLDAGPMLGLGQTSLALAVSGREKDEAVARLNEAMAAAPFSVTVWRQCGESLLTAGLRPEAADAFAHALAIDDTIRRYDVKHAFHLSPAVRAKLQSQYADAKSPAPASQQAE